MAISPISDIVAELKRGQMVVLVDDEDRENEGDLVIAAEYITPEAVNFMATHGRGLICMPITVERARQLSLAPMVAVNRAPHGTNFTVSIEAAEGVTTGISAQDRARTIQVACAPEARPDDIVQPGHVFPLIAEPGGVLARAGHTEACCDLARLAGLSASAVLCEILNEDGSMARLPELREFARRHQLRIGTIADLIRYRMEHESTVRRTKEAMLPTDEFGEFRALTYHDDISGLVHLALVKGEVNHDQPVLVRVHMQESLLDLVTTAHRAGAWSLRAALARVAHEGGVVIILQQPESPDGLVRRLGHLQDRRDAVESSSFSERQEMRTYGVGSQILADLGVGRMRVLGHAMKAPGLSGFGLKIDEYIEAPSAAAVENLTKRERSR